MTKLLKSDEEQQEEQDYAVALEMASIQEMPIQWLWPGRIVMENLTLLVGEPGTGKSALAIDIAARVTRGAAWPDGTPGDEPKSVLMVSAQDHAFFTMRPALAAAGADMNKIATAYDARDANDREGIRRPLDLPRDFNKLRKLIKDRGDCKLVVIDPITAFVRGGASLRNTLMTLVMMAGDLHVAILAVTHLRPGGMRAMYRTEGGSALTSAARGVWLAVEDRGTEDGDQGAEAGEQRSEGGGQTSAGSTSSPQAGSPQASSGQGRSEGGKRRLLLPVKNNLVGEMPGLAYRLGLAEGREVPKVEWEAKGVGQTADEALAREAKPKGRKLSVLEQATKFLQEMLAYGPWRVKEIELAAEMMHGIKRRTLVRARKALYIKCYREKRRGEVWMRLPSEKEIEEKMRKNSGTVGTHTENPGNQGPFSHEVCVPSGTHKEVVGTQENGEEGQESGDEGHPSASSGQGSQESGDRSQGSGERGQPSAGLVPSTVSTSSPQASSGQASLPQGSGGGMRALGGFDKLTAGGFDKFDKLTAGRLTAGGLSPRELDNEKRKKQQEMARRAERIRRENE